MAGRLGPALAPAAAALARATELPLLKLRSGVAVPDGERARGETELDALPVSEGPKLDGPGCGAMDFGCIWTRLAPTTDVDALDVTETSLRRVSVETSTNGRLNYSEAKRSGACEWSSGYADG